MTGSVVRRPDGALCESLGGSVKTLCAMVASIGQGLVTTASSARLSRAAHLVAMTAVAVMAAPGVMALDFDRPLERAGVRTWGTEQGLPVNSVVDVLQDRGGFMWFATEQGLVRFDGVEFTVFDRASTAGIGWDIVRSLAESADGTIWAGTNGGGLIRYRAGVFTTLTSEDGLPGDAVLCLAATPDGALWVGADRGLALIRGDRIEIMADIERLGGGPVRAVAADGNGGAWVGAGNQLAHVDGSGIVELGPSEGFPEAPVSALLLAPGGELWAGTNGGGLVRLVDGVVRDRWDSTNGLPADTVLEVALDRHDNLWVGTNGGGIARRRDRSWEVRSLDGGLCGSLVRSVGEDRAGGVWVGTVDGGVCRLYDQAFDAVTERDGLGSNVVLGVLESSDGSIWFGTAGAGLGRLADGRVTMYSAAEGVPHKVVMSLAEQPDGTLWAGTAGGGLVRIARDGSLTVVDASDGLGSASVGALMVDRLGRLWVGTGLGGIDIIDETGIHPVDLPERVLQQYIFNLTEDSTGAVWIGTRAAGLFRLADGVVERLDTLGEALGGTVLDIVELEPGSILVGTAHAGLVRIRGDNEVAVCGRADGLWDDVVMRILDDGRGWLWMSSNRGVFRVRRDALAAFFDGRSDRVSCEVFDTSDGLPSTECNGGLQPAGWRASDGRLWFPTQGGLAVVDPGTVEARPGPAPVIITALESDVGSPRPDALVRLDKGSRSLTVHYSSPTFDDPEDVRFRYRLEGLDDHWVEAGARRTAFYTNLPPGRFTFRVGARRAGGPTIGDETSMVVEVPGHFYQQAWFPIFAVLCAGAAGFALSRGAVLRLRRRQRELERLIREREEAEAALRASKESLHQAQKMEAVGRLAGGVAHDFNNFLMTVTGSAELLAATLPADDPGQEDLTTILRASEHAAGLTRQLLAFSRQQVVEPRDIDIVREVESLSPLLERLLGEDIRIDLDLRSAEAWIHADSTQVEQIVLNLAANARDAMARGGTLTIRVDHADGDPVDEGSSVREVVLEFEDTGSGIPADDLDRIFEPFFTTKQLGKGTGLGLATVYATTQDLGGSIDVDSEVGVGTRFRLRIPATERAGSESGDKAPAATPVLHATVLLVEDDSMVRASLARQLEKVGAEVWEADGTGAALTLIEEAGTRVDVVLSDVVMPDGSGRELASQIHALHPDIPVVLMSGYTDDRLVHHGVADGEIDFLQKPFSASAAIVTLRRAIERVRAENDRGSGPAGPA